MITQYTMELTGSVEHIPSHWAYRLYSWLLSKLPEEFGDLLHENGEKPLSQYIRHDKSVGKSYWIVTSLLDDLTESIESIFSGTVTIPLHTAEIGMHLLRMQNTDYEQLVKNPISDQRQYQILFNTPTAFKQNGEYNIFPDVKLILQNLISKWNTFCSMYPLEDDEVFHMLVSGLKISEYSLKTSKYPLKDVKIPGYVGTLTLMSKLSSPLEEVSNILFAFAPYAGIGIKTTLGMGGVDVHIL